MLTPNPLRSIGFAQERLHTGLIAFLVDLYRHGMRRPLRDFLSHLGIELSDDDDVRYEFERWKADLVLGIKGTTGHRVAVFEFKVDSVEGGFFEDDAAHKQTTKIAARAEREEITARHYYYVTLGAGEFAGPPFNQQFRWVRLDTFRSAVALVAKAHPILSDWDGLLKEEQERRHLAPEFAAAGKLDIWDDSVRSGGYRKAGVCLAVYGSLIDAWSRAGYEKKFGRLRAYAAGRGPDPILNVEGSWRRYRNVHLYCEVNQNGKLNFKVGNFSGGAGLDAETWRPIVAAIKAPAGSPAPVNLREEPQSDTQTCTVCSWDIGLWKTATSPDEVVSRLAEVLSANLPAIEKLVCCG